MIGVFADDDMSQQTRSQKAAVKKFRRQHSCHRCGIGSVAFHPGATNLSAQKETPRFIIELLADFFADMAVERRIGFDGAQDRGCLQ